MDFQVKKQKQMVAVSRAEYRGVQILENVEGFTVFLSGRRFNCETLSEATSLIDTAMTLAQRVVTSDRPFSRRTRR